MLFYWKSIFILLVTNNGLCLLLNQFLEETLAENQYSNVDLSIEPSDSRTEKENKIVAMMRDSTVKENTTTNRYDPIEEDNVYMNETCSSGILLEKLDSTVAKQGTKEYNDFKKEYAVRHFFYLFSLNSIVILRLVLLFVSGFFCLGFYVPFEDFQSN